MEKEIVATAVLAVVVVFACTGCVGIHADGPDNAIPAANSGVSSAAPSVPDPRPIELSSLEESDGSTEKMDVTITIDGEDYALPMSFADFTAKGWAYYDPSADGAWDIEIPPGLSDWLYFSKGDIKALKVCASNFTDSALPYSQCEVRGFAVDYDAIIDAMDAKEIIHIPAGSIRFNHLGIGEATQKEFAEEFSKARFMDATDGTYRNGREVYDPSDTEMLNVIYDENAVMSAFQYILHRPHD